MLKVNEIETYFNIDFFIFTLKIMTLFSCFIVKTFFSPSSAAMSASALSVKPKLTTIWVHPEETTKTLDDELDDMFCAPCLTKMKQGSCGGFMEAYLRCSFKAFKTNSSFEPCVIPHVNMIDCFAQNPKEYARELASMAKSKPANADHSSASL